MEQIRIEEIRKEELPQASDVLGKAFATQPSSPAIYRDKSDIARRMQIVFGAMLEHLPGQVFVAKQDGRIVGAMRIVEWPHCQMSPFQGLRMLPTMMKAGGGFSTLQRVLKFRGRWAKYDPKKPHWHLDPIGITPDLQGQGIGSQMTEYYCNHVDGLGMAAYHETDRPENVKFYERFGFKIIGEELIMNFPNWYMWRSPNGGV
ncbi:MAG: GNAT family N-acetyltransferase [Chloroflexi bacterium]|nr:GNAT family N-acetyltransferase [Chloroflexota bacterium]